MAQTWAAKAPTEIVEREWAVPVDEGDSVASFSASISGATLDASERDGDTITLTISSGSNGATAIASLSATTTNGLVLVETFYLPIRAAANALGYTVNDICAFALRKVVGADATPTATEQSDARERLTDMLVSWAGQGADLGVKLPCEAADILYVSDAFASAIKANLTVAVADLYGSELSPVIVADARRGLQQIKSALLPDHREGADYY